MVTTRSVQVRLLALVLLAVSATGCDLAQGIFKAGFWVGVIVVVLIAVGVIFLLGKVRR